MPNPLKRPYLGRVLASLHPLDRAGPLPLQTGFPTSLADLVVKNHVRLRKPRKPRRPSAVVLPSSPAPPVAAADDENPARSGISPVQQQQDADVRPPPKGDALFRLRPELLALGGAVELALLAVWSKWLIAAFSVASLSLLWIESVRPASRRRRQAELLDLCGRGPVSPIREVVEPETETPRSSSDKGSKLGAGGDDPTTPEAKGKRSLRKLIAKKLHKGKKHRAKDSSGSCDGDAGEVSGSAGQIQTDASVVPTAQTPTESGRVSSSSSSPSSEGVDGRGGKFPLAAFILVILAGLVAGKLPATALIVLCVVFSGAVGRLPS